MPNTATAGRRWAGLLGADRRQRARAGLSLLALLVYLVFGLVQHGAALMGLVDPATAWALSAFNLTGALSFYLLVRSGLLHRHLSDAHTVMAQMGFAMVCISLAYTATGPVRAVPLVLMTLVLPFGSFALQPGQMRVMALLGFVLMAAAMAWRARTLPLVYEPMVEGLHAAAVGAALAAVAAVSSNLGRLRAQLQAQREALTQALERIQALATCDELTGLANRREALVRLQAMLQPDADADASRQQAGQAAGVALVLVDLDHFKRINDEAGHAAGDAVLRRFAQTARATLGPGPLVARWGGEEFLLALPGQAEAAAMQALARLAAAVRRLDLGDIRPGLALSFSAGVTTCQALADLESAIDRADAAMYNAKRAGRDRTVVAGQGEGATVGDALPRPAAPVEPVQAAEPAQPAAALASAWPGRASPSIARASDSATSMPSTPADMMPPA